MIEDYVDYTMAVGQSKRERECDQCVGTGNSAAVQVTRKEDGFLIYCFRCDKTYFIGDTNASPSQVRDMMKTKTKKKYDSRPDVVRLPPDFTNELPPLALVDLYKYEIEERDMKFFNIGWSQEHMRIIFPFYKYGKFSTDTGWAVKLIGWGGKKLEADENKDKPKWSIVRQRDIKHVRFIGVPDGKMEPGLVVLVEDPISSIRVSDAGFLCIGLMTTYMPDELMPLLRGKRVKIWLDDDAYAKAVKYMAKLGANGIISDVIHTTKDPKAYGRDRIIKEVLNAE
jgi:hypothetical protein